MFLEKKFKHCLPICLMIFGHQDDWHIFQREVIIDGVGTINCRFIDA